MILYTILPLEEIFREKETRAENLQIPYSNGIIEVKLVSASQAKVVRLFSRDLNDYLQPQFQPGAVIKLQWKAER